MMIRTKGKISLLVFTLCLVFIVLTSSAEATDYYVDAALGTNDTSHGTSSGTGAWKTITYALSQVSGGPHTINVAAGTYNVALGETFPISIKDGISLKGAGAASTIINATGSYQRVMYAYGLGTGETLEGFTITGGYTTEPGGGIYITGNGGDPPWSQPTIKNCRITGNIGYGGGGVDISDATRSSYSDQPHFINCTIDSNIDEGGGGGGVYMDGYYAGKARFTNCTITNNTSYYNGGGMYASNSNFYLVNTVVKGNNAYYYSTGEDFDCATSLVVYANGCNYSLGDTYEGECALSGANNIDVNPGFVGGGDYHIVKTSAMIDQGRSSCTGLPGTGCLIPTDDVDGDIRVSLPDIGSDEYSAVIGSDYCFAEAEDETIVDNDEAAFACSWDSFTGVPNAYNNDYEAHAAGAGSCTATWTPDIPEAGNYDVYAWWVDGTDRATNSPYTIYYEGGNATVDVNQQINGGQWNLLGTWPFASWTSGYVQLSDNANGYVIADAVKLVPRTNETIVDNDEAAFACSWDSFTGVPDAYNNDYEAHAAGAGSCTATWTPDILEAGSYDVYAWWVDGTDRATNSPYTINYNGGSETILVNQKTGGGQWNLLGTFNFDTGSGSVELRNDADGKVIADAVKLVPTKYGNSTTTWWIPNYMQGGSYDVYAWWVDGPDRATNSPYTINYAGGSETVLVNQKTGGGQWNLLGTFNFDTGSGSVELRNNADGKVIADAVRLVPTNETIVDNAEATFVCSWDSFSGVPDAYNNDYEAHAAGAGSCTATWTPDIPAGGSYDVYAWWVDGPDRATNSQYTINYAGGSETVDVNQQINGGQWNLLGTWPFAVGPSGYVVLSDDADGKVIADAVKLVPEGTEMTPGPEIIIDNEDAEYVGEWTCSGVPTCADNDGDGYGVCPGCSTVNGCTYDGEDCDDGDASVHPGATETCNGKDDDCDGSIDENLTRSTTCGVGACSGNTGIETCTAGNWGGNTCNPMAGATTEICNGIDDDCDGSIDENLTQQCGVSDVGECQYGAQTCSSGSWGECIGNIDPTAEICDGKDNDCDGEIDEGDRDNDGIGDCLDSCPDEDATGYDANGDGCIDNVGGLNQLIQTLVAGGVIDEQLQNSLLSKVNNAQKAADKENICAAVNQLKALKNEVNAQRGKNISDEVANLVVAYADNVIAGLLAKLPPGKSC